MAAEHALPTWADLVHVVSRGDGAEPTLSTVLPLLRRLTGAATVLVMRRDGDSWVPGVLDGDPLPTVDLPQALRRADDEGDPGAHGADEVPAGWVGVEHVVRRVLPGHLGVLVAAWRDAPVDGWDAALQVVLTGLARLDAEERLADLTARVDNAQRLANMGDYDWHIASDTNRWSDQLYRIYGHEPQSFNPSYERFLSFIHPDDQGWIKQLHQRAYATGEPYAMTERIVRPGGEVRYLSSNGQVLLEDGRPVRMRGTCVDVTDRVLAEQDRERSAQRFRTLVESSPDAILVMDGEGTVVQANGRAHDLLGGDPVGQTLPELVGQDESRPDGAVRATGLDGRRLLLDVSMADLGTTSTEGEVAAFLRDALPRLRSEALAAAVRESQVRRRQAMEINDNVVQGLSVALYSLRDDDHELATSFVERTLHAARQMMSDLLEPVEGDEIQAGDLVRSLPSRLDGATA